MNIAIRFQRLQLMLVIGKLSKGPGNICNGPREQLFHLLNSIMLAWICIQIVSLEWIMNNVVHLISFIVMRIEILCRPLRTTTTGAICQMRVRQRRIRI